MIMNRRVFNEGHAAYRAGRALENNPYHPRKKMDAHSDWAQGWNHARIEAKGCGDHEDVE